MADQYAKRDIMALDKQGGHYWRHANAMTAEGLHSKSDIAAELAYRDARIAELERERDMHKAAEEAQIALRQKMEGERDALAAHVESLAHEIEGALRIKDLWLPTHCEPEHEGECQALAMMHSAFARAAVETPETSLARRDAEQQMIGAASFKAEAHNASILPVRIHLEGVFAAWMSKHERGYQ
ncbi:hypothetical protein [Vreelandella venusta]|uniref:hypothetical protein n=1 Tax=Vreelandella venusta TaxID=44935 RepID=UPI0018DA45F8|nr:hypothetical protein [Halomonas venusta]QPI62389.1 hypothetical protein IR195_10805 [Halomonas venusta]